MRPKENSISMFHSASIQKLQDHPETWFEPENHFKISKMSSFFISRHFHLNLESNSKKRIRSDSFGCSHESHIYRTSDKTITTGESRDLIIRLKSHRITRMNNY